MPSFEYVGVRAILAGVNEFKRDTSTYNSAVDSMVKAAQDAADSAVTAAKAQQAAWDKTAKSAVDASRSAIAASDAVNAKYAESIAALQAKDAALRDDLKQTIDAEAQKTAAVVDSQAVIIREYQRGAAAALAEADANVKAADSAARAARAQLGAAGGRLPSGPVTAGQIEGAAPAAIVAQADAANLKLAETKAALAEVQAQQIAYGATVLDVTTKNVAARTAEEEKLVAAAQEMVAANSEVLLSETQLAAAEQAAADKVAQEALAFEAAAAKKAQAMAVFTAASAAGGAEVKLLGFGVSQAASIITDFGKDLLIVSGILAASFGVALAAGVKSFADLESAIVSVQGVTNASNEQTKELGDTILNLSRNVGVSTSDISKIGQELGRAGFSVDELNNGLIKQVTLLSQASGGELSFANASNFVGSAIHQFGVNVEDVGTIIDATAAVAAKTTLTFTDITNGFKQAAAVAHSAGLSWQQTLAIIADAGQVLGSGTQAGTNLTQMLVRLKDPTDKAAAALNKAGIGVYTASGQFRDFRLILEDLTKAYSDQGSTLNKLSDSEREHALSTIFNTRSLREVDILLQQGVAGYDKYLAAINDSAGFAKKAADVINNTLVAQLQILKNNLTANSIELVQTFIPGLKDLIKSINVGLASDNVIKSVQTLGLAIQQLATGGDLSKVIADIRDLAGGGAGTGPEQLVKTIRDIGDELSNIGTRAQAFVQALRDLSGGASASQTALSTFRDVVLGIEDAAARAIERLTAFVQHLQETGVTGAQLQDVLANIVRIGLVGMTAALAGLIAPLALTAVKVAALALVITELHALYQAHPALAAAATAAILALAVAFEVAANKATILAAVEIVQWLVKIPPPALLGVAALVALGYAYAKVNDDMKAGNPEVIANLKARKALIEDEIASWDKYHGTLGHTAQDLDILKGQLADTNTQLAKNEDAANSYRSTAQEMGDKVVGVYKDMLGAVNNTASGSIGGLNSMGNAFYALANNADNASARVIEDANRISAALGGIDYNENKIKQAQVTSYETKFGGSNDLNEALSASNQQTQATTAQKNALDAASAAQAKYNDQVGQGSQANYGGAAATKKAADTTKQSTTDIDKMATLYRDATKALDAMAAQEKDAQDAIVAAHDLATVRIADDYQKQIDAAARAATDQRVQAQQAYSEQRSDMIAAFQQQESDRRANYATQLSDMQAAFAQQQADLLAQAAFEKTLADQQDAFNQAQKIKSTQLNQQLQTENVNQDYQDKLAALTASTANKQGVAKTDAQKKTLQTSFDLQKAALDLEHQQNLDNLAKQFADQAKQTALEDQLAADQNAFQLQQAQERATQEEAIRQQTYDRQVLAAQQAFDRQELAAQQSLQRQEAAQDQALGRQLQRIDDQQKRADASAEEQRKTATDLEDKRLKDVEDKQDKANTRAHDKFVADLAANFEDLKAQIAKDAAAAGKGAEAVYNDAKQVAEAAHQAALQAAAAFHLPIPPPLTFSPFQPTAPAFHEGGVVGGSGEQYARVMGGETVLTPTQITTLVTNAISVGARNVNSNNSQVFNMHPSYANVQTPGSLTLDLQAMLAASR